MSKGKAVGGLTTSSRHCIFLLSFSFMGLSHEKISIPITSRVNKKPRTVLHGAWNSAQVVLRHLPTDCGTQKSE
jgi:hypothetical protein